MELSAEQKRAVLESWSRVTVVAETGSTNADLLAAAERLPDRSVLVAERQTAGRGRLDRTWTATPGRTLTFSVLVHPAVPVAGWGWLPLLAGVALHEAVAEPGVEVGLKWPNDLLSVRDGRKLAGILAQATGEAAVIGIGLNVSQTAPELPVPTATSLALCGAEDVDRAGLLVAILGRLDAWLRAWAEVGGDAAECGLAAAYRGACATIGRSVSVSVTGAGPVVGTAVDVDATGRLLVDTGSTVVALAAGDVAHVR